MLATILPDSVGGPLAAPPLILHEGAYRNRAGREIRIRPSTRINSVYPFEGVNSQSERTSWGYYRDGSTFEGRQDPADLVERIGD